MKQLIIITIIALFSLFLSGCSKQETVITGQITGKSGVEMLVYSVPLSGTSYLGFNDTLKLDEQGNFELKLKVDQPAFITFWHPEPFKQAKLLIEPGNSYHLVMDVEKDVHISGANEKGQMLYAIQPNPSFIEMQARELLKDTSLLSIHNKIADLKQADLSRFKELSDNREISKSFFELIQADRDCYYASLEARVSVIKTYRLTPNENGKYLLDNGDDLLDNLEKIYTQYPPGNDAFRFSTFWNEYAKYYLLDYKQFIQKDFDIENLRTLKEKGIYQTYIIDESKKYLTGKSLEFFQAQYIFSVNFQSNYEKELIALFEQFKKDYPQSEYTKYLKPSIDLLVRYYQVIEQPFDESVRFMDDYGNINSLEEAIKPLKGKKIYIDVWATWCSPCKREFKNNKALEKILADNDIQQLYISIDEEERDLTWKNDIKFYELSGTHIRANKEFSNDLMKRFDKNAKDPYISIPWYILIDEAGIILKEHAKSPSEIVSGKPFM